MAKFSIKGKRSRKEIKTKMLEFNRQMQMIFQDPYASLNPRMTVLDIIAEGLTFMALRKQSKHVKTVYINCLKRLV